MTDDPEAALLDAVQSAPEDTQARTVYADWLEERGDPRGEYLRLEMQLATIPTRITELVKHIDPAWIYAVGGEYRISIVSSGPNKISAIKVVREVTGLGLREALQVVDTASPEQPSLLFESLELERVREVIAKLEPYMRLVVEPRLSKVALPHVPRHPGAYQRPYNVFLIAVAPARRLDAIRLIHVRTSKGMADARAIVDAIDAGTPFELARQIDATAAADLAVELGALGNIRIERV